MLDEGLSRLAVDLLRAEGLDAVHVQDVGLLSAPDSAIIRVAQDEGRTIFTLDHDFHGMLALGILRSPFVVFLRYQHLRARETCEKVLTILRRYEPDLQAGSAVTVSPGGVRLRRLPLREHDALR